MLQSRQGRPGPLIHGGDFTPKTQTVTGGKCAVEPKEPKRKGYTFEGWYYIDENGKEQKWDFDTPVHSDISLKAVWKKESTRKDKEKGVIVKTGLLHIVKTGVQKSLFYLTDRLEELTEKNG